jgi:hypothetical protein
VAKPTASVEAEACNSAFREVKPTLFNFTPLIKEFVVSYTQLIDPRRQALE